jgi:hypothetical protein
MPVSTKRVQISDDGGTTWVTLPGDTGDLQNQMNNIKDTVFGQDYESNQPGLITEMINAQAFYKGFAGYVAVLKKSGTPTTMTAEATTEVVAGAGGIYRITDAVKRVIDPETAVVVLDTAVAVDPANIEYIDYLDGTVKFIGAYTAGGAITFTAKYLPLAQIAKGKTFNLTQTAQPVDTTDFIVAQGNSGRKTFIYGLKTVGLDAGGFYAVANGWIAGLQARGLYVIEIGPDGAQKSLARGIFKLGNQQQSGKVGDLEEETLKFSLFVPDPSGITALMKTPFSWYHDYAATSLLSAAVRKALTAWEANTVIKARYLYDGTNGYSMDAVFTDLSLQGGLEVMNTFTVKVQGSDTLAVVGTG